MEAYDITGAREAVAVYNNARLNNKHCMYMVDVAARRVWCETKDIAAARMRDNVFAIDHIYNDLSTPEYLEFVAGQIISQHSDENDTMQMTDAEFRRWADEVVAKYDPKTKEKFSRREFAIISNIARKCPAIAKGVV